MMHPTPSNQLSFASLPCDLHDDATCTTRHRSSPVLRQNWDTLAWLASRWSMLPDVDMRPHTIFICTLFLRCKPTNLPPLGFEVQTNKASRWFCGTNHHTIAASFEVQIGKHKRLVLRPNHQTIATSFEANPGETVNLGFEAKQTNLFSSSPCAWCWLHTASPNMLIIRPSSTRLVLDHPQSYSYIDPCCYPSCHTYHLHITRQANAFLHMKQIVG
jgi:hypothetical protein